jgi:hypothetical protein
MMSICYKKFLSYNLARRRISRKHPRKKIAFLTFYAAIKKSISDFPVFVIIFNWLVLLFVITGTYWQ